MDNTAFVSTGDLRKGRQAVSQRLETAAAGGCSTVGSAGKASCGSSDGPDDMPAEIWEKVKNHPCDSEEAPDIKLCLPTNGLALPQMVDEICRYNIDHVTITINMADPAVGEKFYP